jgi:hypothetical protein
MGCSVTRSSVERAPARAANSAPVTPEGTEAKAAALARTFTGEKLEWLKCVAHDKRIPPRAFEVAFAIVQHVNAKTQRTNPSDETISDETGSCLRDVLRARKRLRDAGWLTWERTGGTNVYQMLFAIINAMLDSIENKRGLRKDRREDRRRNRWSPNTRVISEARRYDSEVRSQTDTVVMSRYENRVRHTP